MWRRNSKKNFTNFCRFSLGKFTARTFLLCCAYSTQVNAAPLLEYQVLRTFPHDTAHFTQGLQFHKGKIFESAGGYGHSALYEKDLATGKVLREQRMPAQIFAEGLTLFRDEWFLLSWRNQRGFVFDARLKQRRAFSYGGEGWGLTSNGKHFIMSDGSSLLRWREPEHFAVTRELMVRDDGRPVNWLNELEYAQGWVLSNIWYSDRIAVIDPRSGQVSAWLDLAALKRGVPKPPGWNEREHVLNGIAHDAETGRFYITGKCWPVLFEVQIKLPVAGQ